MTQTGHEHGRNRTKDFTGYRFPSSTEIRLIEDRVHSAERGFLTIGGTETILLTECTVDGDLSVTNPDSENRPNVRVALAKAWIKGDLNLAQLHLRSLVLRETRVSGFANLRQVVVLHGIDLRHARIKGDIFFERGWAGTGIRAENLRAKGSLHLSESTINGQFRARHMEIGKTLHVDGVALLGESDFEFAKASTVWFGPTRPRLLGRMRSGIRCPGSRITGRSFWAFARRTLEASGEHDKANAAYFFERSWMWKAGWKPNYKELPLITAARSFVYAPVFALDFLLLRLPTAYGASIARLLASWIGLISTFALLYFGMTRICVNRLFDMSSPGLLSWPFSLGRSFYFSVITFTTLGYGDIRPAPGLGSALTALEAALGAYLIALTVLVIGKKLLR